MSIHQKHVHITWRVSEVAIPNRSMSFGRPYTASVLGSACIELTMPGKPDIVLSRHNKIILVHGCFWHCHRCKVGGKSNPKSNRRYWNEKLRKNVERDRKNIRNLHRLGWNVLVVWECWTKHPEKLDDRLRRFLKQD